MEKIDEILNDCSAIFARLRQHAEDLAPLTGWMPVTIRNVMAAAVTDDEQLALLREQIVRDRIRRQAWSKLTDEEREALYATKADMAILRQHLGNESKGASR